MRRQLQPGAGKRALQLRQSVAAIAEALQQRRQARVAEPGQPALGVELQPRLDGVGHPHSTAQDEDGTTRLRQQLRFERHIDDVRHHAVAIEAAEMVILQDYLPAQLSDAEVEAAVAAAVVSTGAAGPQDMGKVIGVLKGQLAGKADMGKVSGLVKAALAK